MAEDKNYTHTKEPADCAVEYVLTAPNLDKKHITFYYGETSYLSCALSSRLDGTHDAQWLVDPEWIKKASSEERKEFFDKEFPEWKGHLAVKDETKINDIFYQNMTPSYIKGKVMLFGDAAYS